MCWLSCSERTSSLENKINDATTGILRVATIVLFSFCILDAYNYHLVVGTTALRLVDSKHKSKLLITVINKVHLIIAIVLFVFGFLLIVPFSVLQYALLAILLAPLVGYITQMTFIYSSRSGQLIRT